MARDIGVSPRVLQGAERGVMPKPANQLAIAEAYGLDVLVQWPEDQAA
jgi:hypothetical protein